MVWALEPLSSAIVSTDNILGRQAPKIPPSHKGSQPFKADTDPKEVFAGSKACVLTPEVTEGPFCKNMATRILNKIALAKAMN